MSSENLTYHYHKYTITTSSFENIADKLKVSQVDKFEGTDFVIAFEGIDYPMFGTLYHPEYMDVHYCDGSRFMPKIPEAHEISLNLSTFIYQVAKNNKNSPRDIQFLDERKLVEYEISYKSYVWVY